MGVVMDASRKLVCERVNYVASKADLGTRLGI